LSGLRRGTRAAYYSGGGLKLLLDQNLSRRLLPDLAPHFPGSAQVQLLGLETATDLALWEFACAQDFTIVTKAVDFLELLVVRGFPPKVLWLNCGNLSNAALRDRLLSRVAEIQAFLASQDQGVLEIE
jgi:predicted nuclease of predicted toxin-antitoxin system